MSKIDFRLAFVAETPKEVLYSLPLVPRLTAEVVSLLAVILFAASVALWAAVTNAEEGYENLQGWHQGREFAES